MSLNAYHDTSSAAMPASLYDIDRGATVAATEWTAQAELYRRVWPYFDNSIFDTAVQKNADGTVTPYWPLRIGMVRKACVTHALHLWGLTADCPHLRLTAGQPNAASPQRQASRKQRSVVLTRALTEFFADGNHPALLREGGRLFNVFGGVYLRLQEDRTAPHGCRLGLLSPEVVYPVWNPLDYDQLLRVHIVASIDVDTARTIYGYRGREEYGTIEYVESWTTDSWRITLGRPGSEHQQAVDPTTGEPMAGPNNFLNPVTERTLIPLVYVPRLRTGRFWGLSLADELIGLQDEFNSRMADYGDAVRFASQMHVWGSDLSRKRTPGPLRLPVGNEIFDAGDTGPNGKTPRLEILAGPNVSTATAEFSDKVESIFYDQASISPVMRGIDEGSQRSGATLAARAIPTLALIDDYRTTWGTAVNVLAQLAFAFAYNYNSGAFGEARITARDFAHRINATFAPVLPRDIEAINQTIQIQRSANTMSVERALELSPDVEDPDEELARIKAEKQAEQEQQMAQMEAKADRVMEDRQEMQVAKNRAQVSAVAD